VTVRVSSHHLFGRSGRNITLAVPVTFAEAALGTTVKVPTLTDPVTVRIPPGTQNGATLRVRGRGVAAETGKTGGDLLVTVQIAVPKEMSDETRAAVEAVAATQPDAGAALRAHLGV
jgi:molecular chaperone DnaJ